MGNQENEIYTHTNKHRGKPRTWKTHEERGAKGNIREKQGHCHGHDIMREKLPVLHILYVTVQSFLITHLYCTACTLSVLLPAECLLLAQQSCMSNTDIMKTTRYKI